MVWKRVSMEWREALHDNLYAISELGVKVICRVGGREIGGGKRVLRAEELL